MKSFHSLLYDAFVSLIFLEPVNRVQSSIPLLMFILLIAITSMQTLGDVLHWYSPYLIALGVIVITALLQHGPRNDDV